LCVTFMQPAVCVIKLNDIYNTKQCANTGQMMSILFQEQAQTTHDRMRGSHESEKAPHGSQRFIKEPQQSK